MTRPDGNTAATLDDLLELVENAARTIGSLRSANAALAAQARTAEAEVQAARREAQDGMHRIASLEQEAAALRRDADWCRWFRGKYQDSIFYSHIEQDYRRERLGEESSNISDEPRRAS